MTTQDQWLTPQEEHLWRGWLKLNAKLCAKLQRELQDDAGLSLPDFDILVHLSEHAGGRLRVTDLAALLEWERSRLSHHFARMEKRGLVQRVECAEDGRGTFVSITPLGRTAIEQAAPKHVEVVRRLMFDVLNHSETSQLARILDKLLAQHEDFRTGT